MPSKYDYPGPIRALIFRGFITERVEVAGVEVEIKSLNTQEASEIEERFADRKFLAYLAWSLVRIDGENMLLRRGSLRERELLEFASWLPTYAATALMSAGASLNRWATFELHNVMRFALEPESKIAWRALQGQGLNQVSVTGTLGTDRLGIGDHQKLWAYHNEMAHEEWISEILTDTAIFVASPMAGKGIRPVVARRRMAKQRREDWEKRVREGAHPESGKPDALMELFENEMADRKDEFDQTVLAEERRMKLSVLREILRRRLAYEKIHEAHPEAVLGEPEGPFDPALFARQAIQKINDAGKYMEPLVLDEAELHAFLEGLKAEVRGNPVEAAHAERNAVRPGR